jgi:hypothetical protein
MNGVGLVYALRRVTPCPTASAAGIGATDAGAAGAGELLERAMDELPNPVTGMAAPCAASSAER